MRIHPMNIYSVLENAYKKQEILFFVSRFVAKFYLRKCFAASKFREGEGRGVSYKRGRPHYGSARNRGTKESRKLRTCDLNLPQGEYLMDNKTQ